MPDSVLLMGLLTLWLISLPTPLPQPSLLSLVMVPSTSHKLTCLGSIDEPSFIISLLCDVQGPPRGWRSSSYMTFKEKMPGRRSSQSHLFSVSPGQTFCSHITKAGKQKAALWGILHRNLFPWKAAAVSGLSVWGIVVLWGGFAQSLSLSAF